MTIYELFSQVDEMKPNQYDDAVKLIWLNELEGRIQREIFDIQDYKSYTLDDFGEELLAEDPYSSLYRYYIMLMIDYSNGEFTRYEQNTALFNTQYAEYSHYINRTYKPKNAALKLF